MISIIKIIPLIVVPTANPANGNTTINQVFNGDFLSLIILIFCPSITNNEVFFPLFRSATKFNSAMIYDAVIDPSLVA